MDSDRDIIVSYVNDEITTLDARLKGLEKDAGGRDFELWGRIMASNMILIQLMSGLISEEKRQAMKKDWINFIEEQAEASTVEARQLWLETKASMELLLQ